MPPSWNEHIDFLFTVAMDGENIPAEPLLFAWPGTLSAEDFKWAMSFTSAQSAVPVPQAEPACGYQWKMSGRLATCQEPKGHDAVVNGNPGSSHKCPDELMTQAEPAEYKGGLPPPRPDRSRCSNADQYIAECEAYGLAIEAQLQAANEKIASAERVGCVFPQGNLCINQAALDVTDKYRSELARVKAEPAAEGDGFDAWLDGVVVGGDAIWTGKMTVTEVIALLQKCWLASRSSLPREQTAGREHRFSHVAVCELCGCSWGMNDQVSHCIGFRHPKDGKQHIRVTPWDQYFAEKDAAALATEGREQLLKRIEIAREASAVLDEALDKAEGREQQGSGVAQAQTEEE